MKNWTPSIKIVPRMHLRPPKADGREKRVRGRRSRGMNSSLQVSPIVMSQQPCEVLSFSGLVGKCIWVVSKIFYIRWEMHSGILSTAWIFIINEFSGLVDFLPQILKAFYGDCLNVNYMYQSSICIMYFSKLLQILIDLRILKNRSANNGWRILVSTWWALNM